MSWYDSINIVLGALFLGVVAHELFHFAVISEVSSIIFRFGSPDIVAVCCLSGTELAMENIAYLLQGIVTLGWIIIGVKYE